MDWISQNQFDGCSNTLSSISSILILVIITIDNNIPTFKKPVNMLNYENMKNAIKIYILQHKFF